MSALTPGEEGIRAAQLDAQVNKYLDHYPVTRHLTQAHVVTRLIKKFDLTRDQAKMYVASWEARRAQD